MTYEQEFKEAIVLAGKISDLCDGVDHFEMVYALTLLQTEVLAEMESLAGHNFEPQFANLFKDLLNDARDSRRLNDMDETVETPH